MARGWHYAKLSLSNARRLSFSGMCILLFLFLSLWRFCLFVFFFCSHWSLVDVANPARGLLNRGKKKEEKSLAVHPPSPSRCSFGEKIKNKNHATHPLVWALLELVLRVVLDR